MSLEPPEQAGAEPGPGAVGATEGLFAALEGPLLAYAMRLLKNVEMAEDVVQEAFLRLHRQESEVVEPRGWLYRTVHNLSLNHLRSETRTVSLAAASGTGSGGEEELADVQPLPDEQLARWEAIGRVRLGIEGLDSRSRNLVQLKFSEDLSYKEISARTGLSVGNVGYLLHHALKTLAEDLDKAGLLP